MRDKPKFSILTPVYLYTEERRKMLNRCVRSVLGQTFEDWEHIIINDGSKTPFKLEETDPRQKVIEQAHQDRAIAYNAALKASRGEWICFLDSDDEYVSEYLEAITKMMALYPDSKVFNFGSIHMHRDYNVTLKSVFEPPKQEVGHAIFKSGTLVNGTFVFHRSCYEELGGFPDVTNCWDFASEIFREFPETAEMYTRNDGHKTEVGNPWGQDWYYFYKLTRKYHSQPIKTYLYFVHTRQGHEFRDH